MHSLRVWSLTMDKVAISVHLDTEKSCDSNHVVHEANEKLKSKHGIHFITIQVTIIILMSFTSMQYARQKNLKLPNDTVAKITNLHRKCHYIRN